MPVPLRVLLLVVVLLDPLQRAPLVDAHDAAPRGLLRPAQMLDVEDRLVEQVGDVAVVQRVADLAAVALTDDEAEMTEDAKLMRDR